MNKNKRPTIATVANHAGLSVATVDRVLNARAPVSADTAERVFQAAQAVGYFAARLIGQRIHERRPTYRFGFLLLGTAKAFYGQLADAIDTAARRQGHANLGCQLEYVTDRSPAAIIDQIEQLAVQCDALAVVSFADPQINACIEQIRAAGVPVVALLSDVDALGQMPYVGQDNRQVGRTMGWLLAHLCGERGGSVGVLLGGYRFLGHQTRVDALQQYLAEQAPRLHVLDAVINLDDNRLTEEATLDLLARHPDLCGLCVVGGGGDGVISALRQRPPLPGLCSIVPESTPLSRQALSDGVLSLVIDSQVALIGTALIDVLLGLQQQPAFDAATQRVFVPLQIISRENT
ncbi:putative LacI family regulatory protein [Pseudomonas sp. M47T1]|uniref:LacI family DNA-binding transcriptional regulator n=1 Tax=unclassified Pseudomonas TaxID=196821 RepID=UPI000260810B|nr:LacI family DNA-binding transcriptional regulator [Pseudomonas sp. M47T1]EIK93369.1 putative LacI family regulatory protein [Pseudomonas sp. M47T1]